MNKVAKFFNKRHTPPVIAFFTEQHTYGRHSNINKLLYLLKKHHVKLAISNPLPYHMFGLNKQDSLIYSHEDSYLTEKEKKFRGPQGIVSANFGGTKTLASIEKLLFHHPVFGKKLKLQGHF